MLLVETVLFLEEFAPEFVFQQVVSVGLSWLTSGHTRHGMEETDLYTQCSSGWLIAPRGRGN